MNSNETSIGEKIKEALNRLHMSQADLAKKTKLSPATISKLINKQGKSYIGNETAIAIARALRIPVEFLTTNENTPYKQLSLREILKSSPDCNNKFSAVIDDFNSRENSFHTINEWTETNKFCKKLEDCLNKIIFGSNTYNKYDFTPTATECLLLLSAIWMHNIGQIHGIFPTESTDNIEKESIKDSLYPQIETRTLKYIISQWKSIAWDKEERDVLANICLYQNKDYEIGLFCPTILKNKSGEEVRPQILAALFRLAKATQVDQLHPPFFLSKIYEKLQIPISSLLNNGASRLITCVDFIHSEEKIVIHAVCPAEHKYGLSVRFDLKEIVEICRVDMQENLNSVRPILNKHPNLSFAKIEIYQIPSTIAQIPEKCFSVWPYFIGRPTSATEMAEALIQILSFAIEISCQNPPLINNLGQKVETILNACRNLYPANSLIMTLQSKIGKIFPSDTTSENIEKVKELEELLKKHSSLIIESCNKIAKKFAPDEKNRIIGMNDAIIVYSYSVPFIQALEHIRNYHKGPFYIVNCEPTRDKNQQELDENEKMIKYAKANSFNLFFLKITSLGRLLETLKQEKRQVKIILGIFGVLEQNRKLYYICQNGASVLALTAKSYKNIETIVFAEAEKLKPVTDLDIIKQTRLCFSQYCPEYDLNYFASQIDLIPEGYIKYKISDSDDKSVNKTQ